MTTHEIIEKLAVALYAASEHLSYCGYGDNWERECADAMQLEEIISDALAASPVDEEKLGALLEAEVDRRRK